MAVRVAQGVAPARKDHLEHTEGGESSTQECQGSSKARRYGFRQGDGVLQSGESSPTVALAHDLSAALQVLAKEVMHTRKAVSRMYTNKAQLIAMNAQLTEQLAMVKVAGTLSKSTEVMSMVNNLVKVRAAGPKPFVQTERTV